MCIFSRAKIAALAEHVKDDLEESASKVASEVLHLIPAETMEGKEARLRAFTRATTGAAQFASDIAVRLNKVISFLGFAQSSTFDLQGRRVRLRNFVH
jgi:hypothetical protein